MTAAAGGTAASHGAHQLVHGALEAHDVPAEPAVVLAVGGGERRQAAAARVCLRVAPTVPCGFCPCVEIYVCVMGVNIMSKNYEAFGLISSQVKYYEGRRQSPVGGEVQGKIWSYAICEHKPFRFEKVSKRLAFWS